MNVQTMLYSKILRKYKISMFHTIFSFFSLFKFLLYADLMLVYSILLKKPLFVLIHDFYLFVFVLMGWSLLPNTLRPFQDLLCAPEFRYYLDVNMPIKVCSEAYFFKA